MADVAARKLTDLARQVGRLSPCHRDPERFHEDKDAIRRELMRLAGGAHSSGSGGQ